jgi:hypothetical protein
MKFSVLGRFTALGVALLGIDAPAQAVIEQTVEQKKVEQNVTTTTLTSSGIISAFGPDTLVVKTPASAESVRFFYTQATTYVDESGKQVAIENVRPGLLATIYSKKFGDQLVATRVVVARAVPADPFPD